MTTNYHTIPNKVKLYMSKTPEHEQLRKHQLMITIIKAQTHPAPRLVVVEVHQLPAGKRRDRSGEEIQLNV